MLKQHHGQVSLFLDILPSCPVGLRILAFRPLSGKLKNISLSVLCGSAVKIADPFRVNIRPPVLRVVVDYEYDFGEGVIKTGSGLFSMAGKMVRVNLTNKKILYEDITLK